MRWGADRETGILKSLSAWLAALPVDLPTSLLLVSMRTHYKFVAFVFAGSSSKLWHRVGSKLELPLIHVLL